MGGRRASGADNRNVSVRVPTRRMISMRTAIACVAAVKGQSAMEYLLIVAFSFTLLAAIAFVALSASSSFNSEVSASQVQKIGSQIVDAADAVYYSGSPAKKTMTLYFPQKIENISITGRDVLFTMQGDGGVYEYSIRSASNLTGSIRPFSGLHKLTIEALDTSVNISDG